MNHFDILKIQRNGIVFQAHWNRRYAPVIAAAPLILSAVGTGVAIAGTIEEGKQAEKIAKQRATVDERTAEAVREATVDEVKIRRERGRRILATQKSQAAASGVRINRGSPLLIEAETQANLTQDEGFILERGRVESLALRSGAEIERDIGRNIRTQSRSTALGQGLKGFGTLADLGRDRGLFSRKTT